MLNVQRKFERLEKLQSLVNKKLDSIEIKFDKCESNFQIELNNDQYKLQCDLEEILKDNNNNDKQLSSTKNYLKFYDELSSNINKAKSTENKILNKVNCIPPNKMPKENKVTKKEKRKEVCEKGVETDMQTLQVISYQNNACPLNKINKNLLHKKQNNFLTNELVNLRVKLNKMKNKNDALQNLLKNEKSVKNCKLLEKIISGFIEKLAVNWSDIVDMIIDDLMEQEIFNLNEIELAKHPNRLNTLEDINKNSHDNYDTEYNVNSADKESLYEINKLISDYRKEEDLIYSKYIEK